MKKLLEEMSAVCCISDVDFRNFFEEHKLEGGEEISVRVTSCFLIHPATCERIET